MLLQHHLQVLLTQPTQQIHQIHLIQLLQTILPILLMFHLLLLHHLRIQAILLMNPPPRHLRQLTQPRHQIQQIQLIYLQPRQILHLIRPLLVLLPIQPLQVTYHLRPPRIRTTPRTQPRPLILQIRPHQATLHPATPTHLWILAVLPIRPIPRVLAPSTTLLRRTT